MRASKRPLPGTYLYANAVHTEPDNRTVHCWKGGNTGWVVFAKREAYQMHRTVFGRRVAHRWRVTVAARNTPEKPITETTMRGRMPSVANLVIWAEVMIGKAKREG